jgi:hypothetical protein
MKVASALTKASTVRSLVRVIEDYFLSVADDVQNGARHASPAPGRMPRIDLSGGRLVMA